MAVNPNLLRRSPPFDELPMADASDLAELATMHWVPTSAVRYQAELACPSRLSIDSTASAASRAISEENSITPSSA